MPKKTGGSTRGLTDRGTHRPGQIDPGQLYRAVEPLSFVDPEGVPRVFTPDVVLLGKHEWVQRYPQYWGIEGDPADQAAKRAALTDFAEMARVHKSAKQSGVRILETRMKAKRSVRVDVDGEERKVKKGEVVDPSELICQLLPNAFEEVSVEVER